MRTAQDLDALGQFAAVTWNVYFGTPTKVLRPILEEQRQLGVSVLLMQEAGGSDLDVMLRDAGMGTHLASPQYRVAWDPAVWVPVLETDVRLSDTGWFAVGGKTPIYSDAARVILCDRHGRSLDVVSYHTGAGIQPSAGKAAERRYRALVESLVTLGEIAELSEARAVLFGGDDNWDEDQGPQTADLPLMMGQTNGLRLLQADAPTLGHPVRGREVDDFRIKRGGGIRPVGAPWTAPGGGDHRLHGRVFGWR